MIKSSIDTALLLVISVFGESKITVVCCVTQYFKMNLKPIRLKDGNASANVQVHVFAPGKVEHRVKFDDLCYD